MNLEKVEEQLEILRNGERKPRKNAIESIQEMCYEFLRNECHNVEVEESVARQCCHLISMSLTTCLQVDTQESCREISAKTLLMLIESKFVFEDIATYLLPVVVQRLHSKDGEPVEPCEEIRVLLIRIVNRLIERLGAKIKAYIEDVIAVLCITLQDSYAEVKRESCQSVIKLAWLGENHFYHNSHLLVPSLLHTIVQQHYRVRISGLEAIGMLVQHGSSESFHNVYSAVAQRLLDQVPQVRRTVTSIVGKWIVSMPDRYSCFGKLIALLLSSLSDEVEEIKELAKTMWNEAGNVYLEENKTSLEDQIDYDLVITDTCFKHTERPSLGCRVLVASNFSYILPAVLNDLRDWKVETRIKASELMTTLLCHVEKRMVGQLQNIVTALIVGCDDDEPRVVREMISSAELVGGFVSAEIWWGCYQSKICDATASNLTVLAALIRGSSVEELQPLLKLIVTFLAEPTVCQASKSDHRRQVFECIKAVLNLGNACSDVSSKLFVVLLTLLALSEESNPEVNCVFSQLCDVVPVDSRQALCALFADDVFTLLEDSKCEMWTSQSPEWLVFNTLLQELGTRLEQFLQTLLPFIQEVFQLHKDHEMKFRCLHTLSHLLTMFKENGNSSVDCTVKLIQATVLPCLEWHAGKTIETLRAAAVTTLWLAFKNGLLRSSELAGIFDCIFQRLDHLFEDDNKTTRQLICKIFTCCFKDHCSLLRSEHFVSSSSRINKCLDDQVQNVRLSAVEALEQCILAWLKNGTYQSEIHQTHLENVCDRMLIYLDDTDEELRWAVLSALKKVAECNLSLLKTTMESRNCDNFHQPLWNELTEYIGNLSAVL